MNSNKPLITYNEAREYANARNLAANAAEAYMHQINFARRFGANMNNDFDQTYAATERLCKTETNPANGTTLADWMREGDWQNMTPAVMAAEWDALGAQQAEADALEADIQNHQ
jgi:hypothetical protein